MASRGETANLRRSSAPASGFFEPSGFYSNGLAPDSLLRRHYDRACQHRARVLGRDPRLAVALTWSPADAVSAQAFPARQIDRCNRPGSKLEHGTATCALVLSWSHHGSPATGARSRTRDRVVELVGLEP